MQSGPSFRLVVRRGPQPNQQFLLTRETVTIGRDITNDIVINDPEISRHHSRLIRTPTGYMLEDLRSTNGTFVNRQRIGAPTQLSNGDTIGLGETVTLAFEATSEAVASTMVASGSGPQQAQPMPPAVAGPPPGGYASAPAAQHMPMADEDEFQPDRNRWIVIGCAVLTVAFCCALLAGVIIIDQYELYCSLPMGPQIFNCP
ncbi:MAG: FHA domain-containing protein [Anaerolineae bacterium]|nr:FHA domain-containing protein [Anaerolineae bacterium]